MSVIRAAMPFQVFAQPVVAMGLQLDGLQATWKCTRCAALVSELTVKQKCIVPGDRYHTGNYRWGYEAGWSCCHKVRKRDEGCCTHDDEVNASHTGRP